MNKRIRVLSLTAVLVMGCLGAVFVAQPIYRVRLLRERRVNTQQQARGLWWAIKAYSDAHGGRLPVAAKWEDDVAQAAKLSRSQMDELVLCPLPKLAGAISRRFALNSAVAGQSLKRFDASPHAVLFFESSATNRNASDPLSTLAPPKTGGHTVMTWVGFANGFVDQISDRQFVGYASWAAKQIKPVPLRRVPPKRQISPR